MGKRLGHLLDRWFGRDGKSAGAPSNGSGSGLPIQSDPTPDGPEEARRLDTRSPASRTETLRWVTPEGSEESASVTVEDDSDLGVRVLSPMEPVVGATVWLTFNGDVEKCVVRHCLPADDGFAAGLYRVRQERRREDRDVVEGKADLFWGGLGADVCHIEVDVRDVSANGMQVLIPRPIPPQTTVRISGQDYACLGVTCYCRPDGQRYAVGVQFTQEPYFKESAEYDG